MRFFYALMVGFLLGLARLRFPRNHVYVTPHLARISSDPGKPRIVWTAHFWTNQPSCVIRITAPTELRAVWSAVCWRPRRPPGRIQDVALND